MSSNSHYRNLHRKIVAIMAAVAIAPVLLLAAINYTEFQATFNNQAQFPFRSMVAKSRNSFELFLAERSSTVSLIASAYSFEELSDPSKLQRIFRAMQREFSGFVDIALVSDSGTLLSYAGPYDNMEGKDYSQQAWFNQVRIHNRYISNVFEGFRNIPHIVIAAQHITEDGKTWIVRAALDISPFNKLIAAMNLEPGSDAFLVNHEGILQTNTTYFGNVLEKLPLAIPAPSYETNIITSADFQGNPFTVAYSYLADSNFILMAIKPAKNIFQSWLILRLDLLGIFLASILCIYYVAAKSIGALIERLKASDKKREQALQQIEHSQKLSSIGRMAAGVAHEINNPLAIINEKAGLLTDLMQLTEDFPRKDSFHKQLESIKDAVKRCRDITHRMLGFSRRMDTKIEELDINNMLEETMLFFEKEAMHRNIQLIKNFTPDIKHIFCDRGQLQQVFLNILNNAIDAMHENNHTTISTDQPDPDHVRIRFADNGCGMDEDTRNHIFEPFYTTKQNQGTGLGMFIIYGIVKRHGGEIQVESETGTGTTITIILPVGQPAGER